MEACHLIAEPVVPPGPMPEFRDTDRDTYMRELRAGLSLLADRVHSMVTQAHSFEFLPVGNKALLAFIAGKLEKIVRGLGESRPRTMTIELQIVVSDKKFELDGPGAIGRDLRPVLTRMDYWRS
jgi:hypothetical protein